MITGDWCAYELMDACIIESMKNGLAVTVVNNAARPTTPRYFGHHHLTSPKEHICSESVECHLHQYWFTSTNPFILIPVELIVLEIHPAGGGFFLTVFFLVNFAMEMMYLEHTQKCKIALKVSQNFRGLRPRTPRVAELSGWPSWVDFFDFWKQGGGRVEWGWPSWPVDHCSLSFPMSPAAERWIVT